MTGFFIKFKFKFGLIMDLRVLHLFVTGILMDYFLVCFLFNSTSTCIHIISKAQTFIALMRTVSSYARVRKICVMAKART